ncbi:MAG TPA: cupredoxin family copper-binding protein [Conexibacter sp.]|nr:cupredoxin family copper-binding protein [Conexibacter sp.]
MRRIFCIPLVLALVGCASAVAQAASPRASGSVVGAAVAVSGTAARAPAPAATAVAASTAAASADDVPTAHAAASTSVAIRDFSFGPKAITVHVGDTVTWANVGPTDHTATADDGAFDTGTLKAGQSGSHTFASAGTFAYHCTLHPFMRGTVQVVAATSGGGSASAPSGGSATGAAEPSGTATPSGAASAGPTLPRTGLDALGLAAAGALALLCGVVLRARTRPR